MVPLTFTAFPPHRPDSFTAKGSSLSPFTESRSLAVPEKSSSMPRLPERAWACLARSPLRTAKERSISAIILCLSMTTAVRAPLSQ